MAEKVQLGARVPEEIRALAVEAASRRPESLNIWVERAIRHLASEEGVVLGQEHVPGQTDLFAGTGTGLQEYIDTTPQPPLTVAQMGETLERLRPKKPFAKECIGGAYHWKHGPGNPCRSCKGEV